MASSKKRCVADLLGIPCTAGTYNLVVTDCENFARQSTTGGGGGTIVNPVTNLTTSYSCGSSISLSWSAVSGATYEVREGATVLGTPSTPSFTITGASNGNHTYSVYAKVGAVYSNASSLFVTVEVCSSGTIPDNVSSISTTGYTCGTSVSLTWGLVSGATSYNIYEGATLLGNTNTGSFSITGATIGNHTYTIKSVNAVGESTGSAIYVEIEACTGPTPNPVNNISVGSYSCGPSGTLSWDASAGATSYNVYDGATLLTNTASTVYNFSGLSNGNHSLGVTALNTNGSSAISSILISVAACGVLPSSPTGGSSNGYTCGSSVVLSWTAGAGATSYNVYDGATFLYNVGGTSIGLVGQTVGVHNYRIYSANSTGQNNSFLAINVTIDSCPTASWSFANNFGNTNGYYLEQQKSPSCGNDSAYDVINGNEYNYGFTYTPTNYYTLSVPGTYKIRFNYTAGSMESWYNDNLCVQQVRTGQNFPATTQIQHQLIVEEVLNGGSPTSSISGTSTTGGVYSVLGTGFGPSSPGASRAVAITKNISGILSGSAITFYDEFTVTTSQANVRLHVRVMPLMAAQGDIIVATGITGPGVQIF